MEITLKDTHKWRDDCRPTVGSGFLDYLEYAAAITLTLLFCPEKGWKRMETLFSIKILILLGKLFHLAQELANIVQNGQLVNILGR